MIKSLRLTLAERGKIKIGGKGEERKAKNSDRMYRLPLKYNHFVVTTNERGKDDNFLPDKKIMEKIGEHPKELKVILPYDDPELNFLTRLSWYQGRKLLCSGDAEKANRAILDKNNVPTKKTKEIECDPETCPYHVNKKCKPSGLLSVILPDAANIGGFYKFRTSSWNTITHITSSMNLIKGMTGGILANIPLRLEIIMKSDPEFGKLTTVNLVSDGNEETLRNDTLIEMKNRKKFNIDIKQIESNAVAAGITTDNDDPGDVEDEFYRPEIVKGNSEKSTTIDAETFVAPADIKKEDVPKGDAEIKDSDGKEPDGEGKEKKDVSETL